MKIVILTIINQPLNQSVHQSTSAWSHSRSVRFGFVVNIVPRDDIVAARGRRPAYREDEPSNERPPQQLTDLLAFSVTWQVSRATCAGVPLTWIRVMLLHVRHYEQQ